MEEGEQEWRWSSIREEREVVLEVEMGFRGLGGATPLSLPLSSPC